MFSSLFTFFLSPFNIVGISMHNYTQQKTIHKIFYIKILENCLINFDLKSKSLKSLKNLYFDFKITDFEITN
jgi:hypothetical protein